jgi:VanZ family protein
LRTFLRYWLPVVLWAGLIALLSTSEFNSNLTLRVLRAVVSLFVPDVSAATLLQLNAVVRKLAHVTEYFILGLLVWRALRRGATETWRARWTLGTLAVGMLWAAADETHQLFARGRRGSLGDVGFDTLGLLLALLLLYVWRRRARSSGAPE